MTGNSMIVALRSFRDLMQIEAHKSELQELVASFELQELVAAPTLRKPIGPP